MKAYSLCEKLLHAAEIRGWALKMAYLRPGVPFLPKFIGLAIGEKHAGKIPPQKVGVGPSSETDTITGQQGVLRSVG